MTIRLLNGGVRHVGMEIVSYGLKSIVTGGESWSAGVDSDVYDIQGNRNRSKGKSYPRER